MNKVTQLNIAELIERGGVVKSSTWVTGKGAQTTGRAIPPGWQKFYRERPATHTPEVAAYFEAHRRVTVVIARSAIQEMED